MSQNYFTNKNMNLENTHLKLGQHEFKMTHIKSLVETIIDILVTQDYLVNKLKNHVFE